MTATSMEPTRTGWREWLRAMRPRDSDEPHRAATPLELLFDLTFVVAVAAVVPELAHAIASGHPLEGIVGYVLVFFAIWWAWMNFTWFASAYDCDDALYRVLTMVQMAGVLVLAAGIHDAFAALDFTTAVAGYVLMRIAMVAQWLRAAYADPAHRTTTLRYAGGIFFVQILWVVRLSLPQPVSWVAFGAIALIDLGLPYWAERARMTTWHPHHIAERYGLFTIIVLGECVLATTTAVVMSKAEVGVSRELTILAVGALVLLFACWWLYFLEPAGSRLAVTRGHVSFIWGYGHFAIFASLAAIGAGVEVAIEALTHEIGASPQLVAYAIAVPIAIFITVLWLLQVSLGGRTVIQPIPLVVALALLLIVPLFVPTVSVAGAVVGLAAIVAALIVVANASRRGIPPETEAALG